MGGLPRMPGLARAYDIPDKGHARVADGRIQPTQDDDHQIKAELQRNFHLLACFSPKLLDQSSLKFHTI